MSNPLVPIGNVSTVAFNVALEAINRNLRDISRKITALPRVIYRDVNAQTVTLDTSSTAILSATLIAGTTKENDIAIELGGRILQNTGATATVEFSFGYDGTLGVQTSTIVTASLDSGDNYHAFKVSSVWNTRSTSTQAEQYVIEITIGGKGSGSAFPTSRGDVILHFISNFTDVELSTAIDPSIYIWARLSVSDPNFDLIKDKSWVSVLPGPRQI